MNVIKLNANYQNVLDKGYVVAIGNFDGIHKAHEQVLKMARKIAKENNLIFALMTFDTTPRKVVNHIDNYYILRSQKQKYAILESLGVDTLFLIEFDETFKDINPKDFVQRYIINNNIKYVVCGFDFGFGKNKEGNVQLLCKYHEFKTIILSQEKIDEMKIGSSLIHELILNGEIEKANSLLTIPYSMQGIVVEGNQRGRTINFPTANLLPDVNYRIPKNGVYATKTIVDGKSYNSMTNIGHNPTFNFNLNTRIETNIFDFDQDIYGKEIEVIFYKYIRSEKVFDNITQLINQMNKDKKQILDYFKEKSL
ncbi:riboflavin biosynthesis protein RibF [Mycoplasma sp. P36-A1]|uniref:riboflavin biosynthesis protein RibF n=1 Tax=Mycoplasma sp. P36-A1 TaxID=3252900 RepID=UPI003C2FFA94